MKIAAIHVDGFGVLSDFHVDSIPDGLSVVHGPNETGKSTLLDFIRGVLFGFPDRRQRRPMHEPIYGGRHGGSLQIIDDHDALWSIARHLDAARLEIIAPDGELADEIALRKVLGDADDNLFRAIFAFGLSELTSFESIDSDEIRDLVFSAGVLGAGRSATRAIKALSQRSDAIVRPKKKGAVANQLRENLSDLDARLRHARANAEGYEAASAECVRLRDIVTATNDEIEQLRARARQIEILDSCWPASRRIIAAKKRLEGLGEADPSELALIDEASEIKQLFAERSGHLQRLQQFNEQAGQLTGIEREISRHLLSLGSNVDLNELARKSIGLEDRDRAASITERHREVRLQLGNLEQGKQRLDEEREDVLVRYQHELSIANAREEAEIRELLEDAEVLRSCVARRDQRRNEIAVAANLREIERLTKQTTMHSTRSMAITVVAVIVSTLLVVCAVILANQHHLSTAIGAAVLAMIVLAVRTIWTVRTRKSGSTDHVIVEHDEEIEQLEREIEVRAKRVGLGSTPSMTEVGASLDRLVNERADRQRLDGHLRELESVDRRLANWRQQFDRQRDDLHSLERQVEEASMELGFGTGLTPTGFVEAIDTLVEVRNLVAARRRVTTKLTSLGDAISAFEERFTTATTRIGSPVDLSSGTEIEVALDTLASSLEHLKSREAERVEAQATIHQCSEDIRRWIGEGSTAERLREELQAGEIMEWNIERDQLSTQLGELSARHDAELTVLHDAERSLSDRSRSNETANLEVERAVIESELDKALVEWTIYEVAQSLLHRTLDRYEKDRQPIVIARAAELFCGVTNGRYVGLLAREDDDRHHGISALTASGQRVDSTSLSRGTSEQLYLCLRLAFAMTFAERAISLPLVLDDILVNFDPKRAIAMARTICEVAEQHQVLAFTCHPHVVDYFMNVKPAARVIELVQRD